MHRKDPELWAHVLEETNPSRRQLIDQVRHRNVHTGTHLHFALYSAPVTGVIIMSRTSSDA